jgi:Domain of unknown function (DUF4386)
MTSATHTSSASPATDVDRSIRAAAVVAGVGMLLMSVLAGFGNFVAVRGLVAPGDAARTAANIMGSESLFRLGVVSLFLVIALDVVVAWGLYRVFSRVDKGLSMLAAALRLVFAGVFLAALGHLLGVLRLLGDDAYLSAFSADQLHAQVMLGIDAFNDLWMLGLGLFGLHLILVGHLAHRSGHAPRLLSVLIAVAGVGYLFDSFGVVLSQGTWTDVGSFTFIGEFLLALWLLIRSRRLAAPGAVAR